MNSQIVFLISVWALPVLLAVTLHEAAHAYVAKLFGDDTGSRLGRVSLNPLRHIDPFGTVLLPALLLIGHSPFLFGYAKPVPVKFGALRYPRLGMALVAAAGPLMNLALAVVAALLLHLVPYVPPLSAHIVDLNLKNAMVLNVVLVVFNLFPIPPLDGGRIAVALLPGALGRAFARLERVGMLLVILALVLLPVIGDRTGVDLSFLSRGISEATHWLVEAVLHLTGST